MRFQTSFPTRARANYQILDTSSWSTTRAECLRSQHSHTYLRVGGPIQLSGLLLSSSIGFTGNHHAMVDILGEVHSVGHEFPCSTIVVHDGILAALGTKFQATAHRYLERV